MVLHSQETLSKKYCKLKIHSSPLVYQTEYCLEGGLLVVILMVVWLTGSGGLLLLPALSITLYIAILGEGINSKHSLYWKHTAFIPS